MFELSSPMLISPKGSIYPQALVMIIFLKSFLVFLLHTLTLTYNTNFECHLFLLVGAVDQQGGDELLQESCQAVQELLSVAEYPACDGSLRLQALLAVCRQVRLNCLILKE